MEEIDFDLMQNDNLTDSRLEKEILYLESLRYLALSGKLNIYSVMTITLIGLLGNSLTIVVFSQKRFRINSNSVFLLCLAIGDSLFLLIHLFEDTFKTYRDLYGNDSSDSKYFDFNLFNLMDRYDFSCRLINYLRNVIRFVSAYIVVLFTIQRLLIVYRPLSRSFRSKKSAWKTVLTILLVSLIINLWVPFLFKIQPVDGKRELCDVSKKYQNYYFHLNIFYTTLIMLIPMVIILYCNFSIIKKTAKEEENRRKFQNKNTCMTSLHQAKLNQHRRKKNLLSGEASETKAVNVKIKPHYVTQNELIKINTKFSKHSSKKLTLMLLVISFSFVFLNLPYLLTWTLCFYEATFQVIETHHKSFLFAALQVSEIFYVLNYAIKFYIYCTTSSLFKNQLKTTSNLILFRILQKKN